MFKELWKAHAALFAVNALYGASHVIAKGIMPTYLSPNAFILLRVTGATLLFWPVLFMTKGSVSIKRKDLPLFALCGLFGVAINQLFFFHGLHLSSSINSGIIMTVNPILVVILSYFILQEKITVRKSLGIALGATGAVLLTLAAGTGTGDSLLGDLFLFINAASYAIYLVIAKPLMREYSPLKVITWVFTFGLIYVLLFPPSLQDLSEVDFMAIPQDAIIKIIYIIVGVTFLTYLLTMYGLKQLTPSVSSAYIYLQPVLVIFFAIILSKIGIADDYTDTITWEKIAYMLVIFVGVYLTSSSSFLKRSKEIKDS